jgi:hypothetical protein
MQSDHGSVEMNSAANLFLVRHGNRTFDNRHNLIVSGFVSRLNTLLLFEILLQLGFLVLFFTLILPKLYLGLYGSKLTATVADKYMMEGVHTFGPNFDVLISSDNGERRLSIPVDSTTYNDTSIGDHIEVIYSKLYDIAGLPTDSFLGIWWLLILLGLALITSELILLKRRLRIRRFITLLETQSQLIEGKIATIRRGRLFSRNPKLSSYQSSLKATYEFRSPTTGHRLNGKFTLYLSDHTPPDGIPTIGTKVTIFYLNDSFYHVL